MFRCLFIIVLFIPIAASAQDWQWEQFEGDFYNPTGFPGYASTVGDFDGDGFDELFRFTGTDFTISELDEASETLHWLTFEGSESSDPFITWYYEAMNLDSDLAEEIVGFGQFEEHYCWKLLSSNPWTFVRRDDLLAELPPPTEDGDFYNEAIRGDFDGDGRIENIYSLPVLCLCVDLAILERNSDGSWNSDSLIHHHQRVSGNLFHGDYDNDGDEDWGYTAVEVEGPHVTVLFKNTGVGMEEHMFEDSRGCGGGDLDHDGGWEGLRRASRFDGGGYELVEWWPNSFGQAMSTLSLSAFKGTVLGNFHLMNSYTIAGFQNWTFQEDTLITWGHTVRGNTGNSWEIFYNGLEDTGGHILSASLGDMNSDGEMDVLIERAPSAESPGLREWRAYENYMFEDDYYDLIHDIRFEQFTQNEDTSFFSPQLGQIGGDQAADLFVLFAPDGSVVQVAVYKATCFGPNCYSRRSDLSNGLPMGFFKIRTADFDNDGIVELLGTMDNSHWSIFFFRSGRWQDYSHILPEFESSDLGFADFDNDGDLDLFTDEDVWISLSPSPASDPFILSPSSFILSVYPNPFNPTTTIRFDLPVAARVALDVFNIEGRNVTAVADRHYNAGTHSIEFDGSSLASGLYFARLQTNDHIATTKLMLIK